MQGACVQLEKKVQKGVQNTENLKSAALCIRWIDHDSSRVVPYKVGACRHHTNKAPTLNYHGQSISYNLTLEVKQVTLSVAIYCNNGKRLYTD